MPQLNLAKLSLHVASSLVLLGSCVLVTAQQLKHPVYRVAKEGQAAEATNTNAVAVTPQAEEPVADQSEPAAAAPAIKEASALPSTMVDPQVAPASTQTATVPFDLQQKPGEHPLMPCIRAAKQALGRIDQGVNDYSATFTKVERINGKLGDPQQMQLRVRHQPFSVYMKFVQPNPGQEVLYVADQNNGKLVALASGWKRRIGKLNLDPTGTLAMSNQRYPITKAGIRNLTNELIETATKDTRYGECTVTHTGGVVIDGRETTMIETTHPVPRKEFRYHKARIFIDNEYGFPIAFEAYSWPTQQGGKPVLEERYIYTNLQLNQGYTDADFSTDNPQLFQ